jgi:hypothetical protein
LKTHDTIGLWPAPIVADAHAQNGTERTEHWEAKIPYLEETLFQVLARPIEDVGMTGQMHLAVLANDPPRLVDKDGGVEAPLAAAGAFELGSRAASSNSMRVSGPGISCSKNESSSSSSSIGQRGKKVVSASSGNAMRSQRR